MTVRRARVGDVLRLQRRAVHVELDGTYQEIGIRSFGNGIFHKEPVSGLEIGSKRVFRIEPGDLVISNVFAWEGAVAQATRADAGRIGSHRFMTFTPRDDRIDTSWARWFFVSEQGLELLRYASPGSAGRNRTLAVSRLEALKIPLPPLQDQRNAARRLDRISTMTQELSFCTGNSSILRQAVAESLARNSAKTPTSVRIGDILELQRRAVEINPTWTYTLCGIYSFGKGMFHREPRAGADLGDYRYFAVRPGDLVVSNIQAWEGAIAVARENDAKIIGTHRFLTYTPKTEGIETEWVRSFLLTEEGMELIRSATPGSTIRNRTLAIDRFESLRIPLPSAREQEEVASRIRQLGAAFAQRYEQQSRVEAMLPAALNRVVAELT